MIVLSLVLFCAVQANCQGGGPYTMRLEQVGTCDSPAGSIIFPTKIKRLSRSDLSYSCNCTIGEGFNDDQSLLFNAAKFGNGGWKPNFFTMEYKKVCQDAWPVIGNSVRSLFKTGNKTGDFKCPLPPGVYPVNDYVIKLSKYEKFLPVLPYGRFRVDIDFRKKTGRSGCFRLFVNIEPKSKSRH